MIHPFRKPAGFTLAELIVIMIILAIIVITAMAYYFNMVDEAELAAEKGVVGGVKSGIQTYVARNGAYPSALDSAAIGVCDTSNPCFDGILGQGGITRVWEKTGIYQYLSPTATVYTYNSTSGVFQ